MGGVIWIQPMYINVHLALLVVFVAAAHALSAHSDCVVPHTPNEDDSPAIMEVFRRCNVDSTITFSRGVAYNAWTPMKWQNLSKCLVSA